MKPFPFRAIGMIALSIAVPAIVFAKTSSFTGPSAYCSTATDPSACNAPGVLWNYKGTIGQQDAELHLTDGNSIHVDKASLSKVNVGNYNFTALPSQGMQFNVYGSLITQGVAPYTGSGFDGRVQADQFCFTPGNPADCITSWPSGGPPAGTYVLKAGDTMSGNLSITTGGGVPVAFNVNGQTTGAVINGNSTGVFGQAPFSAGTIGVQGNGDTGGVFVGKTTGAHASTQSLGVGTAVMGDNGQVGGFFSGSQYGVNAQTTSAGVGTKGVVSSGAETGGDFSGSAWGIKASGPQGGYFNGTIFGVNANSASTAVIAGGGTTGVSAQGSNYGVSATTQTAGSGTAVQGYNGSVGGDFTGSIKGILARTTNPASGTAVSAESGDKGFLAVNVNTGADLTGSSYGVDAKTTSAGSGTAVRGSNGQYGGSFTGTYTGAYNNGGSFGALNYGGSFGTYSVGGTGGLFYDGGYSTYTYISQTNGAGVQTNGGVLLDGTRGIEESANTSPMITRAYDPFNAGVKGGVGRWGLFLEPSTLVAGIPNLAGRAFNVGAYNADGSIAKNLLYVNQNGNVYIDTGGLTLGNGGVSNLVINNGNAWKPGGGSWNVTSDARLKDIHGDFSRGLNDLMSIQPVSYNYKPDNAMKLPSDQTYIGVVAQNVQKAIPEAVTTNERGYLQVNNDPIIWTMLNSIKELKAENDQLKARLDALEAKLK